VDLPGFGLAEVWVLADQTTPGGFAWYEKSSGVLIRGRFYYNGGLLEYNVEFRATNADMTRVVFDHDLKVTLNAPETTLLGETHIITAQVQNIGKNDETGVTLDLYYNGNRVDQTILNLAVGEMATVTYTWTPTAYSRVNFTAVAPAITDESYTANNLVEKFVHVVAIKLFDGMYINHTFTLGIVGYMEQTYDSRIKYAQLSTSTFHVDWNMTSAGVLAGSFSWDVNASTRVIENASSGGFSNLSHTPGWIYNTTILGELVPIGTLLEGDHLFNVTGDLIVYLPGFGLVDVWVLSDLTAPGGFGWYEKSSGILIRGSFSIMGGFYYYTVEFGATNAHITEIPDLIPPSWVQTPVDQVIKYGKTLSYDVNATDLSGIDHYSINDTTNFKIDSNGVITNTTTLAVGEYWVEIRAYDHYGNDCSAVIKITVEADDDNNDPDDNGSIPGYDLAIVSVLIGVSLAGIVISKRKKTALTRPS
jgi:hypothetical protein